MQEVFVLYNQASGEIKSSGRLDRNWCEANRDGSTTLEFIERKLATDASLAVLYMLNGDLPDAGKYMGSKGSIILKKE